MNQVLFGGEQASVVSYTSTEIVVISPAMNPGLYPLIIPCGTIGNAWTSILIGYTLYVSSFTPNAGSIQGGTIVTVYGDGFRYFINPCVIKLDFQLQFI